MQRRIGPRKLRLSLPFSLLALAAVVLSMFATPFAQTRVIEEEQGLTGFGLALRKLSTTGSVLCIVAHPDDENNALMAKLGRGHGYRTALLSVTRGDGGQNELGPELFEALGILRSAELMSVHRYDGARQYFSRAFEFGYSFSVEETFQKWGRQEILADIVRVIRDFRPTIILSLNPSGAGGGQHHQASAQLAADAFRLAGDPTQFPEQIEEGLRPWKPSRLFQSTRVGMGGSSGGDVQIELNEYDPLLGETYVEFGSKSRSYHQSQGMGVLPRPVPMKAAYFLANSTVESSRLEDSLFDQMDVGLEALIQSDPELEASVLLLEGYVDWAREAFTRGDHVSAVKAVMTGIDFVRQMQAMSEDPEARFLLQKKEEDFLNAAARGHFLYMDSLVANADDGKVIPGEELSVEVRFMERTEELDIEIESVEIQAPEGWTVTAGEPRAGIWPFRITVSETARFSEPYWFREDEGIDRFSVKEGFTGIEDFAPPPLEAAVSYRSFGVNARVEQPVHYRWFDGEAGRERRMELKVVPPISVALSPDIALVKLQKPEPDRFRVAVTNNAPSPGNISVRLRAPEGWQVTPGSSQVEFRYENEVQVREFVVSPPAGDLAARRYRIQAEAVLDGVTYDTTVQEISYPHVSTHLLFEPAAGALQVLDVETAPNLKVGYIMGVGDEVAQATEQLGASVTMLEEEDLRSGDLSQYDTIVTGVRAYLVRDDLIANNHRLLQYVQNGGNLVVQYNKYEFLREQYTPYPVRIDRPHDRVTVEESPVRILDPDHPLFNQPNQITASDWTGWVQERGLYFLAEWDSRFVPLLELQDPWPYNPNPKRGSLVFTEYGQGTYVYTGLAFFRQLPAGVPGAYRLWANLISLGSQ